MSVRESLTLEANFEQMISFQIVKKCSRSRLNPFGSRHVNRDQNCERDRQLILQGHLKSEIRPPRVCSTAVQSFHHGRSKLIKSSKLFLKIRKKSINFVWSHEHASSYVLPYRFFKLSVSNFRIKCLDEFSRNQSSSCSKSHAPKICQYG